MKFTITFEVPDGTTFHVEPADAPAAGYVPPFADELVPFPAEVLPVAGDPPAFHGMARAQPMTGMVASGGACPVHAQPWKTIPAGVSKATGKPYNAFVACPVRGCDQRPAA